MLRAHIVAYLRSIRLPAFCCTHEKSHILNTSSSHCGTRGENVNADAQPGKRKMRRYHMVGVIEFYFLTYWPNLKPQRKNLAHRMTQRRRGNKIKLTTMTLAASVWYHCSRFFSVSHLNIKWRQKGSEATVNAFMRSANFKHQLNGEKTKCIQVHARDSLRSSVLCVHYSNARSWMARDSVGARNVNRTTEMAGSEI